MKYYWLLVIVVIAGCSSEPGTSRQIVDPITNIGSTTWTSQQLSDVSSQNSFRITDYSTPVFVQLSTTWCDQCVAQQQELASLDVAYVVVNVDTQESDEQIRSFMQEYAFSAPHVNANAAVVDMFIRSFGVSAVNVANSPVILVCPGERPVMLEAGVVGSEELFKAYESC